MHVLVTGASGFSGGYIAHALVRRGLRVTALHGRRGLPVTGAVPGLTHACGDLCGAIELAEAPDAIVHAAARSAWPGVTVDDMMRDNVIATRRLIEHARRAGTRTFILFSSLSVHGRIDADVVDEHTPVLDPDAYGLSKRACEMMLEAAAASSALRGLAIRLPGILGPGSVRNWVTTSLTRARAGGEVTVSNPDAPFNNVVHVDDLAGWIGNVLVAGWEGYEALPLGAGGSATAGEVASILAQAGAPGARVAVGGPARRGYRISSLRASARYGYAPTDVLAMVRRFVAENPASRG